MLTSRDIYLSRLKTAGFATIAIALLLFALAPGRWFSFYGWAAVLLAAVVLLSFPLLARLRETGRNRAWALLFLVPGALIGLVQIGYWLAFFRYGPANPVPGVMREMLWMNAGFAVPYAATALAGLWFWLFASLARVDA
jgi:hypothetical protein